MNKKILMFLVLVLVAVAWLSAATITVTSPREDKVWLNCKGNYATIKWTTSGSLPNAVKITLHNAVTMAEVVVIVASAPNTGSYPTWKYPTNIPDGKYFVRVKAIGAAVHGDSQVVTVQVCPALMLWDPQAGNTIRMGTIHNCSWNTSGPVLPTVSLFLLNAQSQQILTIATNIQNTCQYDWKIPENLPVGQYQLLLKSATTPDQSLSGLFQLLPAFPHGVLTPVKKK
jgi:hypothetical protein